MLARLHVGGDWVHAGTGTLFDLPEGPSRHVQVLRLQPGDAVHLFDGAGLEREATVSAMGRKVVQVVLGRALDCARELPVRVTLAVGMPANDRMDALVEKACELGVYEVQPLVCARSVLRLEGDRALKKAAHWRAVAVSACEQSGRAVVPRIQPVMGLTAWLHAQDRVGVGAAADGVTRTGRTVDASAAASVSVSAAKAGAAAAAGTAVMAAGAQGGAEAVYRGVLSLREAVSIGQWLNACDATAGSGAGWTGRPDTSGARHWVFLSGPEGGLSPEEEALAVSLGWQAISLGARVLRADTAPLAALSVIGARYEG